MKRPSVIDIVMSIGTVFLVVMTLVPAVARLQRTPEDARCQSNMRLWAEAVALYTNDYDRRYPTNRPRLLNGGVGNMSHAVMLSPRQFDENGNPIRFVSSINWVEALFPYLISEAKKTDRDWESVMKCPNVGDGTWLPNNKTARMSYVFNYSLLEFSPSLVKNSAKLMMIRELDRLVDSYCRPTNNCTGNPYYSPQSPFLTSRDMGFGPRTTINNKLHNNGSHILFADGHVKYFGLEYFPDVASLMAAESWDSETGQWWNWVNKDATLNKAIAVTP